MVFSKFVPSPLVSSPNRFQDDDTLVQKAGLLEAEVDGEIVALHIESGKCYGMNAVAAQIWSLLAAPRTVSEVRWALMERYVVDEEECREQVGLLLVELQNEGLVEVVAD